MRATGDKLEERFIIPIARELAEGLKAIHDAGIIHRDVKGKQLFFSFCLRDDGKEGRRVQVDEALFMCLPTKACDATEALSEYCFEQMR